MTLSQIMMENIYPQHMHLVHLINTKFGVIIGLFNRNYLYSIVWSTKYSRPYLYYNTFKIRTDHRPLVWLSQI